MLFSVFYTRLFIIQIIILSLGLTILKLIHCDPLPKEVVRLCSKWWIILVKHCVKRFSVVLSLAAHALWQTPNKHRRKEGSLRAGWPIEDELTRPRRELREPGRLRQPWRSWRRAHRPTHQRRQFRPGSTAVTSRFGPWLLANGFQKNY